MIINKYYKHEYCMSCKQENPQDREICECGGRKFIFGDTVILKDDKFQCECGSNQLIFSTSVNMSPIHNTTYLCGNCNGIVGIQTYIKNDYADCEE